MAEGPYSRVYWSLVDEYPDIYRDDRALASWLRLLIGADGAHPAAAPIPRWVRLPVWKTLVDSGLVIPVPPDHYRIKGLHAERERRSEQARRNANARWRQSDGNAPALRPHGNGNASRDETSKDEKSRASVPLDGLDSLAYDKAAYEADVEARIKRRQGIN